MSHPFPTVVGDHQLSEDWSLTFPFEFARRVEKAGTVIWRPGLTFLINVFGRVYNETSKERLAWVIAEAPQARFSERLSREAGTIRYSYERAEEVMHPFNQSGRTILGFVIADCGHVQIASHCDDADALAIAYSVIDSVRVSW